MSKKTEAFEAFEDQGPDAHTAEEWADILDTKKAYIYQLRGDYKEEQAEQQAEADEATTEPVDEGHDPPDPEEPHSDPQRAAEGNSEHSATTAEDSAPETPDPDTSEQSEPVETEPDPTPEPDGGAVEVAHQGTEKLSPDGFEDESVSSIDPPDGANLPDTVSPDDFEGETPPSDPTDETAQNRDVEQADEGSGGVLGRLRGNGESKSTDEVVNEADDEAERERRDEIVKQLEEADQGGADPSDEQADETAEEEPGDGPDPTATQSGFVVDESLVKTLFGLPFEQAAEVTGWEGWRLSEEEKAANAELLIAYCDEQDIDLSTGGMLALSLMSTVGGRAAGYMQQRKKADQDADQDADQEASTPPSDPTPETQSTEPQTDTQTGAVDPAVERFQ